MPICALFQAWNIPISKANIKYYLLSNPHCIIYDIHAAFLPFKFDGGGAFSLGCRVYAHTHSNAAPGQSVCYLCVSSVSSESRAWQKWQMMTEHLSQAAAEFESYLLLAICELLLLLQTKYFHKHAPISDCGPAPFIIPVCSVWWRQRTRSQLCWRWKMEGNSATRLILEIIYFSFS